MSDAMKYPSAAVMDALKPFAAVAENDIGESESDSDIFRPMTAHNRAPFITVGDLRRAAAALTDAPSAPPVMAGAVTAIRAQALEDAAKLVEPTKPRPCDCDRCDCGNTGDAEAVAQWDADAYSAKSIRALIDKAAPETSSIHVIFDGPPSHESGRFVEVENDAGFSINVGEWAQRPDGLWDLVIPVVVSAAALSVAPGRADGWLPIKTAPKDGTFVDLWTDRGRCPGCRWGKHDMDSKVPFGPEGWNGARHSIPTHWMPLPAPPALTGEK